MISFNGLHLIPYRYVLKSEVYKLEGGQGAGAKASPPPYNLAVLGFEKLASGFRLNRRIPDSIKMHIASLMGLIGVPNIS